jgi:hypothetical protein
MIVSRISIYNTGRVSFKGERMSVCEQIDGAGGEPREECGEKMGRPEITPALKFLRRFAIKNPRGGI